MADHLQENFMDGMIETASKSGKITFPNVVQCKLNSFLDAWIITNGYDVGVVKLVGHLLNHVKRSQLKRLTAIAVCKWGSIRNLDSFMAGNLKKKVDSFSIFTWTSVLSLM